VPADSCTDVPQERAQKKLKQEPGAMTSGHQKTPLAKLEKTGGQFSEERQKLRAALVLAAGGETPEELAAAIHATLFQSERKDVLEALLSQAPTPRARLSSTRTLWRQRSRHVPHRQLLALLRRPAKHCIWARMLQVSVLACPWGGSFGRKLARGLCEGSRSQMQGESASLTTRSLSVL
jgi:hypothetical protein